MGDGDAPRRAPLDSCLRRNDARGGVRVGGGWWWWGEGPALAGRPFDRLRVIGIANRPYGFG